MTHEQALAVVHAVADAAAGPVSVFVVDDHGEVIAALAMDGAAPDTRLNAERKAYTAARSDQTTTRALAAKVRDDPVERASFDPRFIFFAIVGATGIAVNLAVLNVALVAWPANFSLAKTVATLFAMTSNFVLNNNLTYRDRRLKGLGLLRGFIGFCVFGAVGAITDIGLASQLFAHHEGWWLSGLAGAIMGVLWNYAMSSMFIWRTR